MRRTAFLSFGMLTLLSLTGLAQAADAPAPRQDLTQVPSGAYELDPNHTGIAWRVKHLGFSYLTGRFSNPTGTLTLDAAKPQSSKLEVSIPADSIATASGELTAKLAMPDFFDTKKFPTATFVSKRITPTGAHTGTIEGDLTLHGVTKPITLNATLIGAGFNPFAKATAIGLHAEGSFNRSDFGISGYTPMVSDQVDLVIDTEFHQAKKD